MEPPFAGAAFGAAPGTVEGLGIALGLVEGRGMELGRTAGTLPGAPVGKDAPGGRACDALGGTPGPPAGAATVADTVA